MVVGRLAPHTILAPNTTLSTYPNCCLAALLAASSPSFPPPTAGLPEGPQLSTETHHQLTLSHHSAPPLPSLHSPLCVMRHLPIIDVILHRLTCIEGNAHITQIHEVLNPLCLPVDPLVEVLTRVVDPHSNIGLVAQAFGPLCLVEGVEVWVECMCIPLCPYQLLCECTTQ